MERPVWEDYQGMESEYIEALEEYATALEDYIDDQSIFHKAAKPVYMDYLVNERLIEEDDD